jgi:hypothetical protein
MTNPRHQEIKLHWKWVIISVIAGIILVGAAYFIVAPTFHSPEVQVLVMLVGFIVMGGIIGYFSPGITIKESSVGGAIVLGIMLILLLFLRSADIHQSFWLDFCLLLLGISFSWIGGWVGEQMQGSFGKGEKHPKYRLHWKWVLIGIVIGFALNIFIVFVIGTLIMVHLLKIALAGFVVSLITTGFLVGLHSPGETIKEPAVAGAIAVVLDWIFIEYIVTLHVPFSYFITGLILGFLLALLGGWLGEQYQVSLEKAKAKANANAQSIEQ